LKGVKERKAQINTKKMDWEALHGNRGHLPSMANIGLNQVPLVGIPQLYGLVLGATQHVFPLGLEKQNTREQNKRKQVSS